MIHQDYLALKSDKSILYQVIQSFTFVRILNIDFFLYSHSMGHGWAEAWSDSPNHTDDVPLFVIGSCQIFIQCQRVYVPCLACLKIDVQLLKI